MSGESSQTGWNSWFGPSGEPVEDTESGQAPERAEPQEQPPTPAPEVTQRESGLPKRQPRVLGRGPQDAQATTPTAADEARAASAASLLAALSGTDAGGERAEDSARSEVESESAEWAWAPAPAEVTGEAIADAGESADDANDTPVSDETAGADGAADADESSDEEPDVDADDEESAAGQNHEDAATGAMAGDDSSADTESGANEEPSAHTEPSAYGYSIWDTESSAGDTSADTDSSADGEPSGDAEPSTDWEPDATHTEPSTDREPRADTRADTEPSPGAELELTHATNTIKTDPPELSPWSAPPAATPSSNADDETALARPVRLEPYQDLIATRFVHSPLDDQPTQIVADNVPTQVVPQLPEPIAPAEPRSTPDSPPASPWPRPSEPAQLWGTARDPFTARPESAQHAEAEEQPQTAFQAYGSAYGSAQTHSSPQRPAFDYGDDDAVDEQDDGDDDSSRRRESPAAVAGQRGAPAGQRGVSTPQPPPRRRSRGKVLAGGLGGVVVIVLVLLLIINQTGSGHNAAAQPSGFQPTATAPAGAAKETADAFLADWSAGKLQQAAALTDDPADALSTLTAYRANLHLAGLELTSRSSTAESIPLPAQGSTAAPATAGQTQAGQVTFSVAASVGLATETGAGSSASASSSASPSDTSSATAGATTAQWSYQSKLTAYQRDGGWWIRWTPGLVAPNLTAGVKVVSVPIPPQADEVTDAEGNSLADAADPGLRNIAAALKKDAVGQGTPGIKVQLQQADGTPIAGTAAQLSRPVNTGMFKTTIDAQVETAAMHAVGKYPQSAMVVIQPSTGHILAVANNAGQNDFALTARIAPGSTNKIITSTALMTAGLVSSTSQAVACPKTVVIDGLSFGNSDNESRPAGTPFLEDFALSCNNAFTQWYDKIGPTTLAQTARKYYGLNQQWDIGLGPAGPYYNILPSSSGGELAMELFGQGQLEAAPLAMASVAATVANGSFKQPIVVPGQAQPTATPLPADVQQNLWKMMHAVTQSGGTAAGVYSGLNDEVYAKTGTADVGVKSTQQQNSWMVVFDPKKDIAIGCVVLGAGFGASFAGPETASVLKALQ